jgi:hypothetical protein
MAVTLEEVRAYARQLPRTTEGVVRDSVRFRIGRIVYLGFDREETIMGFAFPKEEREGLVASDPDTFLLPRPSELRYSWCLARMAKLDADEMRELVLDAWRMCVPKQVAADYERRHPLPGSPDGPPPVKPPRRRP